MAVKEAADDPPLRRELDSVFASRPYRLGEALLRGPRMVRAAARRWETSNEAPGTLGVRVAAVVDPFTAVALRSVVELHDLHPFRVEAQLEHIEPDIVFLESAWEGRGRAWLHEMSHFRGRPHSPLRAIAAWTRRNGVPLIFWNKEDPISYETFLPVARLADHVATTDANRLDHYAHELGHDRVSSLPFACSPRLHHPFARHPVGPDGVVFAGSWLGERFAERQAALDPLLSAALAEGELEIYERVPGQFPDRYRSVCRPPIDSRALVDRQRSAMAVINVNSVYSSPTMLARRVVEALGTGSPVISSPSPAVRMFDGVVLEAGTEAEASRALEQLRNNRNWLDRSVQGWRIAHGRHTYEHRFRSLFKRMGVATREPRSTTLFCGEYPIAERFGGWTDSVQVGADLGTFAKRVALARQNPDSLTLFADHATTEQELQDATLMLRSGVVRGAVRPKAGDRQFAVIDEADSHVLVGATMDRDDAGYAVLPETAAE